MSLFSGTMPATKNQIRRLEILDDILNRKKLTQQEILRELSDKLDGESIDKRTLYRDMNYLENEKGAPIHRPVKGDQCYYYTHKFSIKSSFLDEDDIACLKKGYEILKQVDNFHLLEELGEVIARLENRTAITVPDQDTVIQFEKHTTSAGHEHLEQLYEAIQAKVPIRMAYQPFINIVPAEYIIHPYFLKEFRNRWFLLARQGSAARISIYALDRIKRIKNSHESFIDNDIFEPDQYFKHLIGVSIPSGAVPEVIEVKVYKESAPYILSKPIHTNQEVIKQNKDGSIIIRLTLVINFELKSILMSYGAGIEIKKPKSLRSEIMDLLDKSIKRYR